MGIISSGLERLGGMGEVLLDSGPIDEMDGKERKSERSRSGKMSFNLQERPKTLLMLTVGRSNDSVNYLLGAN